VLDRDLRDQRHRPHGLRERDGGEEDAGRREGGAGGGVKGDAERGEGRRGLFCLGVDALFRVFFCFERERRGWAEGKNPAEPEKKKTIKPSNRVLPLLVSLLCSLPSIQPLGDVNSTSLPCQKICLPS
jgi:hypothetical protein